MNEQAAAQSGSPAAAALPWLRFICEVCGLIYDEALGDPDSGLAPGTRFADIPDDWACPICGVSKADFVPWAPPAMSAARARSLPKTTATGHGRKNSGVLIVGAGRAGWQVAQALRDHNLPTSSALPITMVCACAGDVYDKPQLSVAVARGTAIDALVRETAAQAAQRLNVRLLHSTQALHIDTHTRSLRTTRGNLRWQHLVLAHGAEPSLPAELPPALVWRINDLAAYTRLRAALASGPQRIAIIGAGLVGCELANDLALAGHDISLFDAQAQPLAAQLPSAAAMRLLAAWTHLPIRFSGGVKVTNVERLSEPPHGAGGPANLRPTGLRIRTDDGGVCEVDQVIAATGLRTASRLARTACLAFDSAAGGIVIDSHTGVTSQPQIYALGDCAVVQGRASRYIEPIARQARGIADAISGVTANASAIPAVVLRVKTSSMPITLTQSAASAAAPVNGQHATVTAFWKTDHDDAQALSMRKLAADGTVLATLTAAAILKPQPSASPLQPSTRACSSLLRHAASAPLPQP